MRVVRIVLPSLPVNEVDQYVPVSEIAKAWGMHPMSVRRAIHKGRVKAIVTPNGHYRVHRDHLQLPTAAPASIEENA